MYAHYSITLILSEQKLLIWLCVPCRQTFTVHSVHVRIIYNVYTCIRFLRCSVTTMIHVHVLRFFPSRLGHLETSVQLFITERYRHTVPSA